MLVAALAALMVLAMAALAEQAAAEPNFVVSPADPRAGEVVTFTAVGVEPADVITWSFPDDVLPQSGPVVSHTFATPGSKLVSMTVGVLGLGPTVTKSVEVGPTNLPPAGSFTATPSTAITGESVQFGADHEDPEGDPLTYSWDFGDGSGGSGRSVAHTYSTAGNKTVKLTVSDGRGGQDVDQLNVVVNAPPPPPNAPPAGSFTYAPAAPTTGEQTLFAADHGDPDGDPLSYTWDFADNTSGSGRPTTHTYATPGTKTVKLTVRDGRGGEDVDLMDVTVKAPPPPPPPGDPEASFIYLPASPLPGETVRLASTSQKATGAMSLSYSWDLDGDDRFDDATGASVTTTAPSTPGPWKVRLRVVQSPQGEDIAEQTITVGAPVPVPPAQPPPAAPPPANVPPTAAFAFAPRTPLTGDAVEFLSGSTDPDGQIATQVWDLDGDNRFDDASGPRVSWRYTTPGAHRVKLRVTDDRGLSSVRDATVAVAARPAIARFLVPFPVVRITGRLYRRYTQVKSLSVRAPSGTSATVRCSGRGCPRRSQSKRLGKSRRVSFPAFQRRILAGASLSITVKRSGYVGKYTRFRIRSGAAPARLDLCVLPRASKPRRCPSR